MIEQAIIFFDGVCGLCNRTVDFVLSEDRERKFLFSPLQGKTFQRIARDHPETMNVDSIVFDANPRGKSAPEERCYSLHPQQTAEIPLAGAARVHLSRAYPQHSLPTDRRNAVSNLGQTRFCRLPTSEEKTRFLP